MSSLPSTSSAVKRKRVLAKNWYIEDDKSEEEEELPDITPKLRRRNTLQIHSDDEKTKENEEETDDDDDDDDENENDDRNDAEIDSNGYMVLKKTFTSIKYKFDHSIRKQEFCSIVKTTNQNEEKKLQCSRKTVVKMIEKIETIILNQLEDLEHTHRLNKNHQDGESYTLTKRFKIKIKKYFGFWYIDTRKYTGSQYNIPTTNGISLSPTDVKTLIASMKKSLKA